MTLKFIFASAEQIRPAMGEDEYLGGEAPLARDAGQLGTAERASLAV
jgi:hypothetical protein